MAWYLVIFPAIWTYSSPHKRLLVYYGLVEILPTYLIHTWKYLKLDGPGENDEYLHRAIAREALILYSACVYVFTHPGVWWWAFALASSILLGILLRRRWEVFDAMFPLVYQSLFASALVELMTLRVPIKSGALRGLLVTACINFFKKYGKLDQIRVLKAQLVAHLAEYIMHSSSRLQQSHPWCPDFKYRPLRDGEIRLLIMRRPRWLLGPVETSIVHRPIDPSPDFEAVSYRWGSSDRPHEILIDGCRLAVTSSAFDLLLARRSI